MPFIARWPSGLPAGARCDALIGLQDTLATCAEVVGLHLPEEVGVDSFSWLPRVTQGDRDVPVRESLIHHSINGSFAIRREQWKLCLCPGSGGWSAPRPNAPGTADLPPVQLFDLAHDLSEEHNIAEQHAELVTQLTAELQSLIDRGRSTPGAPLRNTVQVKWE